MMIPFFYLEFDIFSESDAPGLAYHNGKKNFE